MKKIDKDRVAELRQKMNCVIGKFVNITFGDHKFVTMVKDVVPCRLADLDVKPAAKVGTDGKLYTPVIASIICEDGILDIVLDDIERVVVDLRGVIIAIGGQRICLTL